MAVFSDRFTSAIDCTCAAHAAHAHKSAPIPDPNLDLFSQPGIPGFDRIRSIVSHTSRLARPAIPDRHENPR